MRAKRKLKVLVYQPTELHPTQYTSDIRDRFELANTRELGTFPVVDFPGSYAIKPYRTWIWNHFFGIMYSQSIEIYQQK
jgi:hypothetical protein